QPRPGRPKTFHTRLDHAPEAFARQLSCCLFRRHFEPRRPQNLSPRRNNPSRPLGSRRRSRVFKRSPRPPGGRSSMVDPLLGEEVLRSVRSGNKKPPFAAASRFQTSPLTDSNRRPLLTMEVSSFCYTVSEERLLVDFSCNTASPSARRTSSPKSPE